jgi:2-polyprenyl-3-methyl-5-hydroxy-6-metoxy-1,4-benzoquinol methylase
MRTPTFLQSQDEIERIKLKGIESNSGWKPVSACPVCGSTQRRTEFSKHSVEMVCCLKCATRYSSQIAADLNDVYQNPAYVVYTREDTDEHYNYRRERFGRERVGILEKHCGDLSDKNILDVGCGNGYFLSVAMEKCPNCYGAEFSEKLRAFTQLKTGLTVFKENLDELPKRDFDIITLFDIIEHIPDPVSFMKSVDGILNPGGFILIFTPNFDSFSIKVMGHYSSIVDPTEHIVLFTLPSLRFLANSLNYDVVYAETQGLDIQNILAMQQYKGEEKSPFLIEWHNELQAMVNAADCGDYGRIMFRKRVE